MEKPLAAELALLSILSIEFTMLAFGVEGRVVEDGT
jgi:hypothetical protein